MTEHDQQMFLTLLTVTYFADTLEDLALETDALKATAANYNCRFTELYFQQERAFNTAMPYGLRRIESVRTMLTKSLQRSYRSIPKKSLLRAASAMAETL